jgi:hypothetical protein
VETGEPPVIATYQDFGDVGTFEQDPLDHVWRCAPTFHDFMYRFWIEEEIASRTHDGVALSPDQAAYLRDADRLYAAAIESGDIDEG